MKGMSPDYSQKIVTLNLMQQLPLKKDPPKNNLFQLLRQTGKKSVKSVLVFVHSTLSSFLFFF